MIWRVMLESGLVIALKMVTRKVFLEGLMPMILTFPLIGFPKMLGTDLHTTGLDL